MHVRSLSAEATSRSSSPSPKRRQVSQTVRQSASPVRSIDVALRTSLPPSPPQTRSSRVASPVPRVGSPTRIPSPTRMHSSTVIRRSLTGAVTLANQRPAALSLAGLNLNGGDESLLLAQTIPLPDESISDDEDSNNMLSFSAPYERYHARATTTTTSSNSANSPPLNSPAPIVEDALRARAEQAESAAERLLELVEPEDDNLVSPIPPSLLPSSGNALAPSSTNRPTKPASSPLVAKVKIQKPPSTPANKRASVLKQAAMFKDSPIHKKGPSLLDVLNERKHETGWWLKRMNCECTNS